MCVCVCVCVCVRACVRVFNYCTIRKILLGYSDSKKFL